MPLTFKNLAIGVVASFVGGAALLGVIPLASTDDRELIVVEQIVETIEIIEITETWEETTTYE